MSQPLYEALRTALVGRQRAFLADDDGRVCPGASLWTAARTWAAWLQALGLVPGDRVAASLPNGGLYVVLLLACLRAGALPLAFGMPTAAPVALPESFWQGCEGPTGQLSRTLSERAWRRLSGVGL
ncbi:MAG: AMP-binding protein [Candidatus Sericytochromatia bacterium]|nr:AMP-binding protein [Candidatus Sericytochromatia bacterium]